MTPYATSPSEHALAALVHDLRQPLGNIALSASYMEMLLGSGESKMQSQVLLIQQQVERASAMLNDFALQLRRLQVQGQTGENFAFKKAQTAGGA